MAKDFSFDIVSKVELTEIDNCLTQAMKEISTRFDFRGSISNITREGNVIKLLADDQSKIKSVRSVLEDKLIKRGISLKFLEYGKEEHALGGNVKQEVLVKNGISSDKAKEVNKSIKNSKIKVKSQINGEEIRVSSAKKDDLQNIINYLKSQEFGIELQFVNYR